MENICVSGAVKTSFSHTLLTTGGGVHGSKHFRGGTVREFENFKYAQSFVRAMLFPEEIATHVRKHKGHPLQLCLNWQQEH